MQAILNATKGKIGRGVSFFEKAFGSNEEEFMELLIMPETFILFRFFFFIALLLPCTSVLAQEVKVWEETLTLPTYTVDAPEVSPVFDCDWSYQRARRSVYPYVLDESIEATLAVAPEDEDSMFGGYMQNGTVVCSN